MSEQFLLADESQYTRVREAMISWAVYRLRIDRAEAEDYVDEAYCRWIGGNTHQPLPPPAWWRTVVRNSFLDTVEHLQKWQGELPQDPETGQVREDDQPSRYPAWTADAILRSLEVAHVREVLPGFWNRFYQSCTPIERAIADYIRSDQEVFEHDGTLSQIVESVHAILCHECREMGLTKLRKELTAQIKHRFGLSQPYFDRLMNSMRSNWRAARKTFDEPKPATSLVICGKVYTLHA